MEAYYPYIYDIVVIVVLIVCIIYGSVKGFLSIFTSFVGKILAFILALLLSGTLARLTYNSFIEPKIAETISTKIEETLNNNENATSKEIIEKATEGMPEFIRKTALSFADTITINDEKSSEISKTIEESVVSPIVLSALEILIFIILLTIFLIMVKFLTKAFGEVNEIPIIGKFNKLLGAVAGIIYAVAIIIVISYLVKGMVLLTGNDNEILNNDTIENSKIFSYIYKQDIPTYKGE